MPSCWGGLIFDIQKWTKQFAGYEQYFAELVQPQGNCESDQQLHKLNDFILRRFSGPSVSLDILICKKGDTPVKGYIAAVFSFQFLRLIIRQ